jgi:outer membrane receptor protein involved in Fe transport
MALKRLRLGLLALAFFAISACIPVARLSAQSTTQGAIAGTVEDPTGAVVGGAAVTIRNLATNTTVRVKADGSGYFIASLLEPGTYTVTVTAPGFATYTANDVAVVVGQVTSILPHMALSSATTQVVVSEVTPVMNLESPDFSDTLNTRALQSIPINNKRWSALAMTTPGVVSDDSGYGLVSVRGISTLLNNVEIDGADDNQAFFSEERGRTREAYSTTFAAVREFAVNTGVYSAEYGRAAGGVITSVTRSGTNQIHGQAYFWDRESNWEAYTPDSTITNFVNGSNVTTPLKPEDLRKIYGFTASGPLKKNKLFWMYTYDQHTHVFPNIGVPYNNSAFYTLPAALPAGDTCYDGVDNASRTGAVESSSGVVSSSSLSTNVPDACALAARQGISYNQAAYDWAALTEGSANVNAGTYGATAISDPGIVSDIGESPRFGYQEINMPKLDWQISPKMHWSILYNRLRWDAPGDVQTNSTDHYGRDTNGDDFVKLDYGVTKLTTLVTNSISNEVLYQYSRELDDEGQEAFTPYTFDDVDNKSGNIPEVEEYNDGVDFGSPYYSYRKAYPEEYKWQIGDVLYWSKGNHTLRFGVDAVHNYDLMNDTVDGNGIWQFDWDGNYFNDLLNFKNGVTPSAANDNGCASSAPEYYTSSSVIGDYTCAAEFEQGFGPPVFVIATMDTGLFAQDDWKFSPRLTFDLGLRWDKETLPGPNSNFTTATGSYVPYAGLLNNPTENGAFGPRIGFAYDIFGKGNTVLRGGWGLYYGRIPNANIESVRIGTGSPNGQFVELWEPKSSYTGTPVYPAIQGPTGGSTSGKPTSYFFAPNLKMPEVQEFDLVVQQQIGKGTIFEVSYLGALGRELPNILDVNLNPATTSTVFTVTDDSSGVGPLGANGSTITVPVFTGYGNTANPELNAIGGSSSAASNYGEIGEFVSNINSNYDALVVEVLNRSLHSLQFDANYTWSHALDFAQQANTTLTSTFNNWYNPYTDAGANYGNSSWDVPNRFVAYALYNLPNLRTGNWVKYLANDWSLDDTFQMQNGLPFTAGVSGFPYDGILSDLNGASGSSLIPQIGVNTYRYPRAIVDDARVQKSFTFERGYNLALSLNAYNIANHQNITGFEDTALYDFSDSSANDLEYQGVKGQGHQDFMVPDAANNSGFLYTPRELEIIARFNF